MRTFLPLIYLFLFFFANALLTGLINCLGKGY
jgi:hypothetical protein